MTDPILSVLMPVYNGQRYLQPAVESVLRQTFVDFELIVVDDGSTDTTARILQGCRDPRLRVVPISHAGLIGALNAGMAHCSGTFVARMDADDLSRPDRLALQIEYLHEHPEVDLVTCWSDLINEHDQLVGRMTGGVGDDMILELASGNQIVHGSIVVRRAALPPNPVYTEPPEDYRLWVGMAREGRRFHAIPEPLYAFRTHSMRYSLTQAVSQCRGIVDVEWPLLEECSASRDLTDPHVRACLIRGWGSIAGAAYRAGDHGRGNEARRRSILLADGTWNSEVDEAARHGIEAMIWGGCPWPEALALRWREWRQRPIAWVSYRNLLLALPPVRKLHSLIRGGAYEPGFRPQPRRAGWRQPPE